MRTLFADSKILYSVNGDKTLNNQFWWNYNEKYFINKWKNEFNEMEINDENKATSVYDFWC